MSQSPRLFDPDIIYGADESEFASNGNRTIHQNTEDSDANIGPHGEVVEIPLDHIPNGTTNGAVNRVGSGTLPEAQDDAPIQPARPGPSPIHPLNWRDVGAFVVNKMIGTGIFIQPPAVLLLTGSKSEALGLWLIGFIYTLVSMLLYIEFSRKLPHTGGELIYLDETLPTPPMLAYTVYTFYFILMYNTATNSMQFANQVLISANIHDTAYLPDGRLLRFIAVVALSVFCLLHYFSGRTGRTLNQVLAFFKISLLGIVLIAGIVRAKNHFEPDWHRHERSNGSSSASASAFLLIIFSFTGWENATFVSGEIASHRILKKGFISAVLCVGLLYFFVNMVFLIAVPYDAVVAMNIAETYVPTFFGGGVHARFAWAVLIAISASGSLLSVIYTCARVKQVIGMSNIIPWSKLWMAGSSMTTSVIQPRDNSEFPTPQGGLMLHWLFSVILISTTAGMYHITEAISFPGNLQAYASGWVGIFISMGFPFLFLRDIPPPTVRRWNNRPEFILLRSTFGKGFFLLIYIILNLYIIIVPLIGPYVTATGTQQEVKGWYYIVIIVVVVFSALLYYYSVFGLAIDNQGEAEFQNRTILRLAGVYPMIEQYETHEPHYGWRRKVRILFPEGAAQPSYLYWFFGGSNERRVPNSAAIDFWNRLMGN